jgi:hypothetical protein
VLDVGDEHVVHSGNKGGLSLYPHPVRYFEENEALEELSVWQTGSEDEEDGPAADPSIWQRLLEGVDFGD